MKMTISFSLGVSWEKNLHFLLSATAKATWKSSRLTWIRFQMSKWRQSTETEPLNFQLLALGVHWRFCLFKLSTFDLIMRENTKFMMGWHSYSGVWTDEAGWQ